MINEKYLLQNGWHDMRQLGFTQMPYYTKKGYDCDLMLINWHNIGNWQLFVVKGVESLSEQDIFDKANMVHVATFHYKREIEAFEILTNEN